MSRYFRDKVLGDPFLTVTLDEALLATWRFFSESHYAEARDLLDVLVHESVKDCELDAPSQALDEFFFRLEEHFVRVDISRSKQKVCSFDDSTVQATCGTLYLNGERVKRNTIRAATWLERAAKHDNIYALFTLARLYLDDKELQGKQRLAFPLLEKAAALGDDDAPTLLAFLFSEGTRVQQDYVRAAHWARMGAGRNSSHAQGQLGYFYAKGLGVAPNLIEAAAWTYLSASKGEANAKRSLPMLPEGMSSDDLKVVHLRVNELSKLCDRESVRKG